ncbi:MAG: hypothetical protein ACYS74_10445, partial [Planctomycetota bacterium]
MVVKKCLKILTVGILLSLSAAVYAQTQDIPITQGSDDTEERSDGSMYLGSSDLELVNDNGQAQTVG